MTIDPQAKSPLPEEPASSTPGEVAGSFLLGLVDSFCSLHVLPDGGTEWLGRELEPTRWYPYSLLIDTLDYLEQMAPASDNLFFRAGVHFLRIWYEKGPGKAMISSGLDWLYANKDSGGYNSVVRGGTPDEVGWCRLQTIDEQAGIAIYEDVTPQRADYVRGLFFGGCILFDDMEFVDVTASSEPYAPNPAFTRKIITVRFRLKPRDGCQDLEARLDALTLGERLALTAAEQESLIWRYKGLKLDHRLESSYHKDINTLLSNTIHKLRAAEEQIRSLAYFDTLTDLPNRRSLLISLDQALAQARRFNRSLAVMFLDLDHFKPINDSFGHDAGDQLLREVATRLSLCVRGGDTVARTGGDEFVIVLTEIARPADAARIAEKIIAALHAPFSIAGHELVVSTSIGICVYPVADAGNAQDLIKKADIAMYGAKQAGRNCFGFYFPDESQPAAPAADH